VASSRRPSWTSFLDRLDGELTVVEEGIQDLLDKSTIRYVNPNTPDSRMGLYRRRERVGIKDSLGKQRTLAFRGGFGIPRTAGSGGEPACVLEREPSLGAGLETPQSGHQQPGREIG
jgi:hypothetical protein